MALLFSWRKIKVSYNLVRCLSCSQMTKSWSLSLSDSLYYYEFSLGSHPWWWGMVCSLFWLPSFEVWRFRVSDDNFPPWMDIHGTLTHTLHGTEWDCQAHIKSHQCILLHIFSPLWTFVEFYLFPRLSLIETNIPMLDIRFPSQVIEKPLKLQKKFEFLNTAWFPGSEKIIALKVSSWAKCVEWIQPIPQLGRRAETKKSKSANDFSCQRHHT